MMIKRFLGLLASVALVVTGCNQDPLYDIPEENDPKEQEDPNKEDPDVEDPDDGGMSVEDPTRLDVAVSVNREVLEIGQDRLDWEVGDNIYVFFDYSQRTEDVEYMIMTWDGKAWTHRFSNFTLQRFLRESKTQGKLYALHFPEGKPAFADKTKKISNTVYDLLFNLDDETKTTGLTGYWACLGAPYTIDQNGRLTASLDMTLGAPYVFFYLPGVEYSGHYLFTSDKTQPSYPYSLTCYTGTNPRIEVSISNLGNSRTPVKGSFFQGGVLFTESLFSSASGVSSNYVISITDTQGTDTVSDDVDYILSLKARTIKPHDVVMLPPLTDKNWHACVDMGNGLKWAKSNVGAKAEKDPGDYFAWGETVPHYEDGYARYVEAHWREGMEQGYCWENYKFIKDDGSSFTKYNESKLTLDPEDDAATVLWGKPWRIPTRDEWLLLNNASYYTWEPDIWYGALRGIYVTSKTTNCTIYFCINGYYKYDGMADLHDGYYWTSSLYPSAISRAWLFSFFQNFQGPSSYTVPHGTAHANRFFGINVRPVMSK